MRPPDPATATPEPTVSPTATLAPKPALEPSYAVTGALADVLVSAGWPGYLLAAASRVVQCESSGFAGAVNGQYLGWFQLHPAHFATYGYSAAQWADPWTNARVAWLLYSDSGWQPWECRP